MGLERQGGLHHVNGQYEQGSQNTELVHTGYPVIAW
jgi:hypothetical protein